MLEAALKTSLIEKLNERVGKLFSTVNTTLIAAAMDPCNGDFLFLDDNDGAIQNKLWEKIAELTLDLAMQPDAEEQAPPHPESKAPVMPKAPKLQLTAHMAEQEVCLYRDFISKHGATFRELRGTKEFHLLKWWLTEGKNSFPNIYEVALCYLCIPATSTPSERAFSASGELFSQRRRALTEEHIREMLYIHANATTDDVAATVAALSVAPSPAPVSASASAPAPAPAHAPVSVPVSSIFDIPFLSLPFSPSSLSGILTQHTPADDPHSQVHALWTPLDTF